MNAETLKNRGPAITVVNSEFQLPEDGYVQIVSIQEAPMSTDISAHLTGQSGIPATQVLDRQAIETMASKFKGEILVDYEHHSHDMDKTTTAAGWIQNVEVRDDGLYAKIRWSKSGREAIEGGDYRFISPEFPVNELEHLGGNRYRATSLTGAGLTNRPGLDKIKPLSNRNGGATSTSPHSSQNKTTNTMEHKLILCSLLGLAATATDEAIQNRVTEFKDEQKTRDNQIAELETGKNREKEHLEQLAERDLETYKDVIKNRDEMKELLITNREPTLKLLENLNLGGATSTSAQESQTEGNPKVVFNRGSAKTPENVVTKANAAEDAKAAFIQNRASELMKTDSNLTLAQAYQRAETECTPAK